MVEWGKMQWYRDFDIELVNRRLKSSFKDVIAVSIMSSKKKLEALQIRNSTAEFLIFTSQANENTIEVRVEDETV